MAEGCVFCRIIDGSEAADLVFRDDVAIGFLDRRPLFPGHVLVAPIGHVVALPDLPASAVGPFFQRVRAVARAIPEVLGATGTFVANNNIVSQSVPHLHVHVVPRRAKDGLRGFFWPRTTYEPGEATAVAARLATALERFGFE